MRPGLTALPLALPLALALAACSGTVERIPADPAPVSERVPIRFRTLEVAQVSLPTYAGQEEIFTRSAAGVMTSSPDLLWADDPARAVTLGLVRGLSQASSARIATAPWPFEELPDARLEVHVEDMVADLSGSFRLAGQYYVAAAPGLGRDRTDFFDITVPLAPGAEAPAIARARSAAVSQLALEIARKGLR